MLTQTLRDIVQKYPPTIVTPQVFFVAWSGVITLAYQGWSPTLQALKAEINGSVKDLKPENPGSKWPKTTLGAMRDGQQLSLQEWTRLLGLCSKWKEAIASDHPFEVDQLSLLTFENRSLEKRRFSHPIPFDKRLPRDISQPAQLTEETIDLNQSGDPASYLPFVNRPGSRESHYRSPHTEMTLVFDLPHPALQPAYVQGFIAEVDQALPGKYVWFSPESRHLTIRAMERI